MIAQYKIYTFTADIIIIRITSMRRSWPDETIIEQLRSFHFETLQTPPDCVQMAMQEYRCVLIRQAEEVRRAQTIRLLFILSYQSPQ